MRKLIFIPILLLALSACEQVIEIEIPPHEQKLVMNAYLIAGDEWPYPTQSSEIEDAIVISNSVGVLTKDTIFYYDDATVHILKNGVLQQVLTDAEEIGFVWNGWDDYRTVYGYVPTEAYQPGSTVTLRAAHAKFSGQIEATQTIPAYVPITAEYFSGARPRIKINFTDPLGPNAYLIRVHAYYEQNTELYPTYFYSYDPGFNPLGWDEWFLEDGVTYTSMGLLSDAAFEGKAKEFELFLDAWSVSNEWVIEVTNIHPDMEKFFRSYYRYWNALDNPLAEPANIFHNVKGGYGTVCAGTRAIYEIK